MKNLKKSQKNRYVFESYPKEYHDDILVLFSNILLFIFSSLLTLFISTFTNNEVYAMTIVLVIAFVIWLLFVFVIKPFIKHHFLYPISIKGNSTHLIESFNKDIYDKLVYIDTLCEEYSIKENKVAKDCVYYQIMDEWLDLLDFAREVVRDEPYRYSTHKNISVWFRRFHIHNYTINCILSYSRIFNDFLYQNMPDDYQIKSYLEEGVQAIEILEQFVKQE